MFAKFKSNIFLIFGLYSFELAHGLLNLIREVSSFSTLLISLLLRLIEVEEKEESKKSVPFQHNKYILRIQPHSALMIMTMVRNVSSLRLPLPGNLGDKWSADRTNRWSGSQSRVIITAPSGQNGHNSSSTSCLLCHYRERMCPGEIVSERICI